MSRKHFDNEPQYKVLMSRDARFSIWPATRQTPAGWRDTGMAGSQSECLAYAKSIWTVKPLGFRAESAFPDA
jgi:MbtH protein